MLRRTNQYPFAARQDPRDWHGQIVKMIIEWHFATYGFFAALGLAHFTVATFYSLSEVSGFTDPDRFSKNGEVQTRHQNPPCVGSPCHRESELVVSGGNH